MPYTFKPFFGIKDYIQHAMVVFVELRTDHMGMDIVHSADSTVPVNAGKKIQ